MALQACCTDMRHLRYIKLKYLGAAVCFSFTRMTFKMFFIQSSAVTNAVVGSEKRVRERLTFEMNFLPIKWLDTYA